METAVSARLEQQPMTGDPTVLRTLPFLCVHFVRRAVRRSASPRDFMAPDLCGGEAVVPGWEPEHWPSCTTSLRGAGGSRSPAPVPRVVSTGMAFFRDLCFRPEKR